MRMILKLEKLAQKIKEKPHGKNPVTMISQESKKQKVVREEKLDQNRNLLTRNKNQ